ncbi:MAG: MFS transporter [Chloroflexi bacterium]|nr:MFS transporter [Chloroflexota bacterium]
MRAPQTSPWRALADPNFRLFLAGQFLVQNGRSALVVALAWLVLDLTGSPLILGSITAAQFTPILVLSLFAGPIADRFTKRGFIQALQSLTAALALTMWALVVSGHVALWQIYLIAIAIGIVNALDAPLRQVFLSEVVGPESLQSAVGLSSSANNAARIVGPSIGGLIIAVWGTGWCFVVTTIGFGLGAASLAVMRQDLLLAPPAKATGALHTQVAEGLGYVRRTSDLLIPLAVVGLVGTVGFNWSVYLPLLARYVFDVGPTGFGFSNAAIGLGSLAGGLVLAGRRAAPTPAGVAILAAVFSVLLFCLSLAPTFVLLLPILFVTGVSIVLVTAGTNTIVQLRSEPAYRGRVLSLLFLLTAGGTPIGNALSGALAAQWDVRVAMAVNAVICLAGCLAAIARLRRAPATA